MPEYPDDRHDDRHDDPAAEPQDDLHGDLGRVDRIDRDLRALGLELDALRAALGRELRTRRVVVVDDDGFERVVVSARGAFGFVVVRARTHGRPDGRGGDAATTAVELFANDPIDADGPHVGVALSDRGDVVATFDRIDEGAARLWFAEPT